MKKQVLILVMLLMAATAFNQASRRPANNNAATAKKVESRSDATSSSYNRTNNTTVSKPTVNSRNTTFETRRTSDKNSTALNNREAYASNRAETSNKHVTANSTQYNRNAKYNSEAQNYNHKYVYYPSTRNYKGVREARYHYTQQPYSITYRAVHYPYRVPVSYNVYWNRNLRFEFCRIYPTITIYRYPVNYRIRTISAYDAMLYHGEIMSVYGKVSEVFYSPVYDEYILYIGPYYPYHDFTVVLPGWIARKYSNRPDMYFENQYIVTTGLISSFDGKPEIVISESFQINLY